ncbi:MAG: transcriptional regulator [Kaistia sp. SCN 65-12]|nr:MAG: transcriptional regulator [Kaistia sp. SCN 65-12]
MEKINTPQLGPLIKRQRKDRNLTLEQLASISGVSKSMLSQVERGQANPTFAVVWSLTKALRIDFTDLLGGETSAEDDSPVEIQTAAHTPEIKSNDRSCRLKILSPPQLAGTIEWYDVEIDPNGVLDSAPHASGAFEHFTALTPGFEVNSGGTTRVLQVGDTARYRADVSHSIANRSDAAARGLLVLLYH